MNDVAQRFLAAATAVVVGSLLAIPQAVGAPYSDRADAKALGHARTLRAQPGRGYVMRTAPAGAARSAPVTPQSAQPLVQTAPALQRPSPAPSATAEAPRRSVRSFSAEPGQPRPAYTGGVYRRAPAANRGFFSRADAKALRQ